MSNNTKRNKPWLNRFTKTLRSAERTIARQMCMGPKKITNNNIGTSAEQCGKFKRYSLLYSEYAKDPNPNVQNLMSFLEADQKYFAQLTDSLQTTSDPVRMGRPFLERFRQNRMEAQRALSMIPDIPEYTGLKTEMRYFIPFMYKVYDQQLNALISAIRSNNKNYVNNPYVGGGYGKRRRTRRLHKSR
jgi:hypothetical protein